MIIWWQMRQWNLLISPFSFKNDTLKKWHFGLITSKKGFKNKLKTVLRAERKDWLMELKWEKKEFMTTDDIFPPKKGVYKAESSHVSRQLKLVSKTEKEEEGEEMKRRSVTSRAVLSMWSHHLTVWPLRLSLKEWSRGCFPSVLSERRLSDLLTDDSVSRRYRHSCLHRFVDLCWSSVL